LNLITLLAPTINPQTRNATNMRQRLEVPTYPNSGCRRRTGDTTNSCMPRNPYAFHLSVKSALWQTTLSWPAPVNSETEDRDQLGLWVETDSTLRPASGACAHAFSRRQETRKERSRKAVQRLLHYRSSTCRTRREP